MLDAADLGRVGGRLPGRYPPQDRERAGRLGAWGAERGRGEADEQDSGVIAVAAIASPMVTAVPANPSQVKAASVGAWARAVVEWSVKRSGDRDRTCRRARSRPSADEFMVRPV
ncbi:MAG TPA: hypothetical protein VGC42_16215, partial [Kofleriaceae bacterium]